MRTAKTLIRLGGCPGWSESSLGAHAILLVLSWGGSYVLSHAQITCRFIFAFVLHFSRRKTEEQSDICPAKTPVSQDILQYTEPLLFAKYGQLQAESFFRRIEKTLIRLSRYRMHRESGTKMPLVKSRPTAKNLYNDMWIQNRILNTAHTGACKKYSQPISDKNNSWVTKKKKNSFGAEKTHLVWIKTNN